MLLLRLCHALSSVAVRLIRSAFLNLFAIYGAYARARAHASTLTRTGKLLLLIRSEPQSKEYVFFLTKQSETLLKRGSPTAFFPVAQLEVVTLSLESVCLCECMRTCVCNGMGSRCSLKSIHSSGSLHSSLKRPARAALTLLSCVKMTLNTRADRQDTHHALR